MLAVVNLPIETERRGGACRTNTFAKTLGDDCPVHLVDFFDFKADDPAGRLGRCQRRIRDVVFEEHSPYPTPVTKLLEENGYTIFSLRHTLFGPVVGAFVILTMQYKLAAVGEWVLVIQGVIFVACVLLFRRGIIGEIAHYLRIKL